MRTSLHILEKYIDMCIDLVEDKKAEKICIRRGK